MKKQQLFYKKTILTLLLCFVAFYLQALTFTVGDITYNTLSTNTVEVGDNHTATGAIDIPNTVENDGSVYTVVSISAQAFSTSDAFGGPGSTITSITISDSVTSIGTNAFKSCSNLASVVIGNSVTSIGYQAFNGCSNLASVVIGNSVTSIGDYAFSFCTVLTSITFPNSVTSIGSGAFNYCPALKSITIGNSVTSIGDYNFNYCPALTRINSLALIAPTLGLNPFIGTTVRTNIDLYVPSGSQTSYTNTWGTFKSMYFPEIG